MKISATTSFLMFSLLAACAHTSSGPAAMATLSPATGQQASGTVSFTPMSNGRVQVKADLQNVPAGMHGFHLHEVGDCSNNGQAAGGHFNPTMMPHGAPDAASHHAGDFGNVTADASGIVHTSFTTTALSLSGTNSAVGRAVVLHGGSDDLTSQPAGNSGPRIACGVVTLMNH